MAIRVPSRARERKYGYVRVESANGGGGGGAPSCPLLLSPSDAATDVATSVTLSWGSVDGATYSVYLDDVLVASGVAATSYDLSGLTAGTAYTWRVTAVVDAVESENCSERSFTTAAASDNLFHQPGFLVVSGQDPGLTPVYGDIYTYSDDGDNWTDYPFPFPHRVGCTTFSPDLVRFVVCDMEGGAWYSDDGTTWERNSLLQKQWRRVLWSSQHNKFFAGCLSPGSDKSIHESADGITWTPISGTAPAMNVRDLVQADAPNRFIAVGSTASLQPYWYSTDGTSWTNSAFGVDSGTVNAVVWASGISRFVAVSRSNAGIMRTHKSTNGVSWTTDSTGITGGSDCLAYSPTLGLFVAMVQTGLPLQTGQPRTSSDGITWTLRTSVDAVQNWVDVVWHPTLEIFLAVGQFPIHQPSEANGVPDCSYRMMKSSDGINWEPTAVQPDSTALWQFRPIAIIP